MSTKYNVAERFMRYVQIDTTADPNSSTFPSSAKQRDLALILDAELQKLGLQDVEIDEWSYVFATIPSNVPQLLPTICFCSHMDTAPDCSGTNVKPILHQNYTGAPITLPDDTSLRQAVLRCWVQTTKLALPLSWSSPHF
jgi:tripeptide aminopeptidase